MSAPPTDLNATIAYLLADLAAVQSSNQSRLGYRRASHAILLMERPIRELLRADGTLEKIPGVGPKSLRVVEEVLASGGSATVDQAVRERGMSEVIATRRALRSNYLSYARVLSALKDGTSAGPSKAEYRGDLQLHSTWSDGGRSVEDMALACCASGYAYAAITDHSHGMRGGRGLSAADLVRQRSEVRRVNDVLAGRFRLLAGVEANIRDDGTLDLTPEDLGKVELVVAAAHSGLRSAADQTERMLAAVRTAGVHILGHPRGRQRGNRAGIVASWDRVFMEAADTRVAIEIDGQPFRQDLDFELAIRARDAGCLFALDSDAHAVEELVYADIALAHARMADIPAERIVNCWPLDRLEGWLAERRAGLGES